MKNKLQILFIPFLIVAIGFAIIYSLFYWFLLHFFYPLNYREPGIILLSTFILAWVPVLIWMRPGINLLVLNKSRGQYFAFQMVCALLITLIAHLATEFIDVAAGKLTILQNINEIDKRPVTKFYKLESLEIAKKYKRTYYTNIIVGRRSKSLRLNVYVVCPVYNKNVAPGKACLVSNGQPSSDRYSMYSSADTSVALIRDKYSSDIVYPDTSQQQVTTAPPLAREQLPEIPKVWLCRSYEKNLKEIVYGDSRKQVENDFYADCLRHFNKENFESLIYLENVENSITRDCYQTATGIDNSSVYPARGFILEPRFLPFSMRWYSKLINALIALACCAAGWLLILLLVKFDPHKLQNYVILRRK